MRKKSWKGTELLRIREAEPNLSLTAMAWTSRLRLSHWIRDLETLSQDRQTANMVTRVVEVRVLTVARRCPDDSLRLKVCLVVILGVASEAFTQLPGVWLVTATWLQMAGWCGIRPPRERRGKDPRGWYQRILSSENKDCGSSKRDEASLEASASFVIFSAW